MNVPSNTAEMWASAKNGVVSSTAFQAPNRSCSGAWTNPIQAVSSHQLVVTNWKSSAGR